MKKYVDKTLQARINPKAFNFKYHAPFLSFNSYRRKCPLVTTTLAITSLHISLANEDICQLVAVISGQKNWRAWQRIKDYTQDYTQ